MATTMHLKTTRKITWSSKKAFEIDELGGFDFLAFTGAYVRINLRLANI